MAAHMQHTATDHVTHAAVSGGLRLTEPMTNVQRSSTPAPQVPAFKPFMRLFREDEPRMAIKPGATGAERRVFPRKEVDARVQGKRLDHTIDARRLPFLQLNLKDVSVGGLAAMSHQPVAAGERISVFFPPEGGKRGWDACGRVIRCDPGHFGYRIAVEFEAIPLAA